MSEVKTSSLVNPSVTVAIPTFNAGRTIEECLASITAQTFPADKTEIIVCDNGSTDDTLQIIGERFPMVKVVIAPQRGSGYARNTAIQASIGRYICSIDADCTAHPYWIEEIVTAFNCNPASVACLGGQILPYSERTFVERYRQAWIRQETLREGKSRWTYAETPNAAFQRWAFERVGYFDGTQGMDDTDMGLRLTAAGLTILYVPAAIVYHRNPATIKQLYHHRRKYGLFTIRLARKYPREFGFMSGRTSERQLLRETYRRVLGDLVFKLPLAAIGGESEQGTRLWPLLDAVVAMGNYVGASKALKESR